MSNTNPVQATFEEAASMEHIRTLIAEARGDGLDPVFVAERVRQQRWVSENPDEVARLISNTRRNGPADEMIPDRDWSKVVGWRSRQTSLRLVCKELSRPAPYYQTQTRHFTVVGNVHRFFILVPPGVRTGALSAVGRFSTDPHLAREDAAAEMIRVLLEISGKHLDDYNYDLLDEALSVNYELQWEIGAVKSSYKELRSSYRYVLCCNNSELVDSDSDSS
ncbi:hypothetical protein HN51_032597 [Arachis hypogaea]|uniref:uncharacterized protein n=1 Tax=Arachis hypogaea TaxID=3818 RepID=UPI000DECDA23|nr:uncharacterized protein LOC112716222 [Arachis hypogaea]QHO16947.1 uncharacterized protein DS421_10g307990 [Arachis hypogaea]